MSAVRCCCCSALIAPRGDHWVHLGSSRIIGDRPERHLADPDTIRPCDERGRET